MTRTRGNMAKATARWLFPSPKSRWEIEHKGGEVSSPSCEGTERQKSLHEHDQDSGIPFLGVFLLTIVTMFVSEIKLVSELRSSSVISSSSRAEEEEQREREKIVKRKLI